MQGRGLPDRREHGLLVHQFLDPFENRLALLLVDFDALLAEKSVDVRVASLDIEATSDITSDLAAHRICHQSV